MGLKQEAGPETRRTGEGRAIEGVKAAEVELLFGCRVKGLHLLGQVGRRMMVVHSHGAACPQEDKTGQNEREDSTDQVHCSNEDHPRYMEFRIHLRLEDGC